MQLLLIWIVLNVPFLLQPYRKDLLVCVVMHAMDEQTDQTSRDSGRLAELRRQRAAIVTDSSKLNRQQTSDLREIDRQIYDERSGVSPKSRNQDDQ